MTDNEGQGINNNLKKSKLVNADGSIVNTQYNRAVSYTHLTLPTKLEV